MKAYWIQKEYLDEEDDFVCSRCRKTVGEPYRFCPECGSAMTGIRKDPVWIDELDDLEGDLDA